MNTGICLAAFLAVGSICQSGEVPLFNGRNLEGWTVMGDAEFFVTNGVIRLAGGAGWLRSEEKALDFTLDFEWRALEAGYDSGVFLRAGTNGVPWPEGAWQVNLDRRALGGLVKGTRTVVPAETPPVPVGQWVKFRIEVKGSKIALDVDEERAWEFDRLDGEAGYLGFQAEGKAFEFRKVTITKVER
jgi:hypothetical protein